MGGDRARVEVTVAVPLAVAFDIFSADIDQWWRRGFKFRHSDSPSSLIRLEPKAGGRLFEAFEREGMAHVIEVGRIGVWQPPHRIGFSWRNANYASNEYTQVDIEFVTVGAGTRVTVTHSGLSVLPPGHPARHGLLGADFARLIGLWWGEQMTSLRLCADRGCV